MGIPVVAYLGAREWARFSVDLALPRGDVPSQELEDQTILTGIEVVDHVPGLRTSPIAHQVADKTCAMFELHGAGGRPSSRARDLADIATIATQIDMGADEIIEALAGEERRRLAAGSLANPLPHRLVLASPQEQEWRSRWRSATRNLP